MKNDFVLYGLFTSISMMIGFITLMLIKKIYGQEDFAEFALSSINVQIIVALSDIGFRYSFFKPNSFFQQRSSFQYLIFIKVSLAILLFLGSLFFYHSMIYLVHLPMLLGYVLFPTLLFQKFKMFGLNSFALTVFRVLSLFGFIFFNRIEYFVLSSGLILMSLGYLGIRYFKIFVKQNFSWSRLIISYRSVLEDNRSLSVVSLVNIFEVYIHIWLAKFFLWKEAFTEFIFLERIASYFKQVLIVIYDFIYPKLELKNVELYQLMVRKIAAVGFIVYLLFFLLCKQYLIYRFGANGFYFLFVMGGIPLVILLLNFVQSVIYFRFGSDSKGLTVIIYSVLVKVLVFICSVTSLGIFAVPLSLVISESFMGIKRTMILRKYGGSKIHVV